MEEPKRKNQTQLTELTELTELTKLTELTVSQVLELVYFSAFFSIRNLGETKIYQKPKQEPDFSGNQSVEAES